MAVIRQQTQVFNKPVGVRRIDTGEAELWEQVAATANEFSERAYKKDVIAARQAGAEEAMSLSSSDIVALDPKTNKPVKFPSPAQFGTQATAAYQEIINKRFEQSVDAELVAQGAYYAKSARNADEYNELISSHVASMINADGEDTYFSRYISEAGTAYANKTYTSMKAAEIEKIRKSAIMGDRANGHDHMNAIKETITSGVSVHAEILESLDKEEARSVRLYKGEGISFAEYTQNLEKIDSLRILSAHTSLAQQFSEFDNVQKKEFLSVLVNPQSIKNFELRQLTIDALINTKPETLANALQSGSARREEYVESAVDSFITTIIPTITNVTQVSDITDRIKNVPIEYRDQVKQKLMSHHISMKIDFASDDEQKINNLQLELNKPNPDLIQLTALLDSHQVDENELVEDTGELAQFIIDMGIEGRKELVTYLNSKITHIRTKDSLVFDENQMQAQNNLRTMQTTNDPVGFYTEAQKHIINSKFSNQQSELNTLGNVFAHRMNEIAKQTSVSYNELTKIKSLLKNPSDHTEKELSENGKYVLTAYRNAYDDIPKVIDAGISARLNDIENENKAYEKEMRLDSINVTMQNQGQVPADDLQFYQDEVFGKDFFINANNLKQSQPLFDMMLDGNMMPAVTEYFEGLVNSTNEDDINNGVAKFAQYTNAQTTSNGTPYKGDRIKNKISTAAYNKLAAAHYTAKRENILPSTAIFELNSYDGNITQDILNDLSGDKKTYKNLYRYFDNRNLSPNYKNQLIAAMKMAKARNITIDDEYVDELIQNYTQEINANADANVLAPTIDGAVEYALSAHVSKMEVINSFGALTDALIRDNPTSPLIGETTTLDQVRQGFRDILGMNAGLLIGTILEAIGFQEGSYDASANLYNQERVRQGLSKLQASIVWKPDTVSFANGVPKWTAGYINDFDRWESISVEGEPWTLTPSDDGSKDKMRFIAKQQHSSSLMSNDLSVRSKFFIELMATLEHFESPTQLENLKEYPQLKEVYTVEQIADIFNAKKQIYNGDNN
jgi:hypothetical protein